MPKDVANAEAFLDYADRYLAAYGDVGTGGDLAPPRVQLIGQAVELALKGFLAATEGRWPYGHDLLDLHDRCAKQGLVLETKLRDDVLPKLSALHFGPPGSNKWKYPSRYPSPNLNVWVTPNDAMLRSLLGVIVDQTRQKIG